MASMLTHSLSPRRRRWIATIVIFVVGELSFASGAEVRIFPATPLPRAAQIALIELKDALRAHGDTARDVGAMPEDDGPTIVVGTARGAQTFDRLLQEKEISISDLAESSALAWADDRLSTLVISGSDERGLTYALRDAARGIAVAARDSSWTRGITPAVESPYLRVRNVSLHLFNADCEREWFFSEEFWRFYFARLSLSRFNRCTLTLCDQTNYLCPPYAYLVDMPEYPQVRVEDCTAEQRAENLAMLNRITELADEYAIDFDLGIWMQAPVPKWAAPVRVSGLPEGMELAKYCALGVKRIYESCPSLDGIQLRMNAEAGVNEEQQTAFYQPMFQALAGVGRPLRVELRYKGLQQATIDAAVAAKLDVTVSTKYWAEHFGLPYHPTVVDSHYAKDRYSFGTLLKKPRNYRVTYQLWTVGSQRLTLWGDPEYAARFAKSCTLGGGEGFEVFAPLTNKGYGNAPGAWQVIQDPAYRVGKWEQERYWMFYLCFGRMGYNPETQPEVWQREFRHRFGEEAAPDVERAYQQASRVLPLISSVLLPGASEWSWWPEMDTGGAMAEYSRIQTGDPGQLRAMRPWTRSPQWRWEDWDPLPGRFDELDAGQTSGRTDTYDFMSHLRVVSQAISFFWSNAADGSHPDHAEWQMTEVDLKLLASLADFHSHKLEQAGRFAIYDVCNAPFEADLSAVRSAWRKVVAATDGVYHDNLVFGVSPENARNKFGHHHSGHWRDRLAEVDADDGKVQVDPRQPNGWNRATDARNNWQAVLGAPDAIYTMHHSPPNGVRADNSTVLQVTTLRYGLNRSEYPYIGPKSLAVRIRPLDQTRPWKELEMTMTAEKKDSQTWSIALPPEEIDPNFDLQYFFVRRHETAATELWPDWHDEQPYFVVPVHAQ